MKKTIIVYGSSTGTCEDLAGRIAAKLEGAEVINVANLDSDTVDAAENLILGTSTWGAGDMQDDWYDGINVIQTSDLSGKTVAIFGCGDAESYPDTFCGGMKEIYDAAEAVGATIVGKVAASNYSVDDTPAVVDGEYVGLAIDEVNDYAKTDERIDAWVEQIKGSL